MTLQAGKEGRAAKSARATVCAALNPSLAGTGVHELKQGHTLELKMRNGEL